MKRKKNTASAGNLKTVREATKKNVGKVIRGSTKNIVSAGNPQDSPRCKIKYGRQ